MKRLLLAALLCVAAVPAFSVDVVESIVARVGDRVITRSQYDKRLKDGLDEIRQTTPPEQVSAKQDEYRKTLLNDMLAELLLKDRADRLNITVSNQEVNDAVGRLKKQYGIESDKDFEESLKKSGLTRADMEARLRDTLLTNKVFARELKSRDELTDRELRDRYEREKEHYRLPERADVSEIIVLMPEGASPMMAESVTSRANQVAEKAKSGGDFKALAKEFSDAPTRDQGGSLGTIARNELLPELDSAVFNAQAPAVIGPIKTKVGYHILKVEQRYPSEVPGFDSVKDRLRKEASDETFQRDYKAYIEKLRKDAFIQIHEDQLPNG